MGSMCLKTLWVFDSLLIEETVCYVYRCDFRGMHSQSASLTLTGLQLDRGNVSQANTDNFLDDLGLSTNDFNYGQSAFSTSSARINIVFYTYLRTSRFRNRFPSGGTAITADEQENRTRVCS